MDLYFILSAALTVSSFVFLYSKTREEMECAVSMEMAATKSPMMEYN